MPGRAPGSFSLVTAELATNDKGVVTHVPNGASLGVVDIAQADLVAVVIRAPVSTCAMGFGESLQA